MSAFRLFRGENPEKSLVLLLTPSLALISGIIFGAGTIELDQKIELHGLSDAGVLGSA